MKNFLKSLVLGISIMVLMPIEVFGETKVFKLPPLPYSYDALEPYIDKETMMIHHDKHEGAYVDNLNKALSEYPELYNKSIEELLKYQDTLPQNIRQKVKNNAGGVYNHEFFWSVMTKERGLKPSAELMKAIERDFGSFDKFKELFKKEALDRFGSGWAWLLSDKDGKLYIISTPNQGTPIPLNMKPILAIDVWEHAYYLKYQNRRGDYVDNFWNVVNWNKVSENYKIDKKG